MATQEHSSPQGLPTVSNGWGQQSPPPLPHLFQPSTSSAVPHLPPLALPPAHSEASPRASSTAQLGQEPAMCEPQSAPKLSASLTHVMAAVPQQPTMNHLQLTQKPTTTSRLGYCPPMMKAGANPSSLSVGCVLKHLIQVAGMHLLRPHAALCSSADCRTDLIAYTHRNGNKWSAPRQHFIHACSTFRPPWPLNQRDDIVRACCYVAHR